MRLIQLLCVVIVYYGCLVIAPWLAGTSSLLVVILVARLFLFAPLYFVEVVDSIQPGKSLSWDVMLDAEYVLSMMRTFSITCEAFQTYRMSNYQGPKKLIQHALREHPAVTTLGFDFVLCLISCLFWTNRGRHTKDLLEAAEAEQVDKDPIIPTIS